MSLNVRKRLSFAPGIVSKMLLLGEARSIKKEGTVLSVVRVLVVPAVSRISLASYSCHLIELALGLALSIATSLSSVAIKEPPRDGVSKSSFPFFS